MPHSAFCASGAPFVLTPLAPRQLAELGPYRLAGSRPTHLRLTIEQYSQRATEQYPAAMIIKHYLLIFITGTHQGGARKRT